MTIKSAFQAIYAAPFRLIHILLNHVKRLPQKAGSAFALQTAATYYKQPSSHIANHKKVSHLKDLALRPLPYHISGLQH